MAVTAFSSGTETLTSTSIGVEHLQNVNEAGTYTYHVDVNNLAANDVVELRVYQMVLTGGTARVAYLATFYGAQPTDDIIKISVPISNQLTDATSLRFGIKQTFGTARSFPWKILKHA
jgi:hypothetical protein